MRTAESPFLAAGTGAQAAAPGAAGGWLPRRPASAVGTGPPPRASWNQWNESPQAQEPVAFGLSIVKPCFSIVSTKSIVAPLR